MLNSSKKYSISLRCPLNSGCHTDRQFKEFGEWIETSISTPVKYRCHGMRGVCMIMGILVSVSAVEIKKEILFNEKVSLKDSFPKSTPTIFIHSKINLKAFTISSTILRV